VLCLHYTLHFSRACLKQLAISSPETCSQALFNYRTACNTNTGLLKSDFVLLAFTTVTMYETSAGDIQILRLVWFPGIEIELQILDLMEEISLLLCISLLSRSEWLCCHYAARFAVFFFIFHNVIQIRQPFFKICLGYLCQFIGTPVIWQCMRTCSSTKGFSFSLAGLQHTRALNLS
jgi:hypothetical protein